MITDEQLDEWGRLAEAATPGPWEAGPWWEYELAVFAAQARAPLAAVLSVPRPRATNDANTALICASRDAVPALIAEVRRLRGITHAQSEQVCDIAEQREVFREMLRKHGIGPDPAEPMILTDRSTE